MTGKEFNYVRDTVEQEGFDYCFRGYSDFPEIEDETFHKVRLAYVYAANALSEYLGMED